MRRFAACDAAALATQALDAAERVGDAEVVRPRPDLAWPRARGDGRARRRARRPDPGRRRRSGRRGPPAGNASPCASSAAMSRSRAACRSATASPPERGLRIAESLGDRASEANMLVPPGDHRDQPAAARRGARSTPCGRSTAGRAAADERALATGLDGLKTAYLSLGDTSALTDVLAELKPLLRRQGDLFLQPWAEFEGAFLSVAAADRDQATAAVKTAISSITRAATPVGAWYTAHLGWLARLRGREDEGGRAGPPGHGADRTARAHLVEASSRAMLGGTRWRPATGTERSSCSSGACRRPAGRDRGVPAALPRSAGRRDRLAGPAGEAAALLEQAAIPAGGAWMFGLRGIPVCRRRPGSATATRNGPAQSSLRCWQSRSGSRGRRAGRRPSSSTAAPSPPAVGRQASRPRLARSRDRAGACARSGALALRVSVLRDARHRRSAGRS